MHRFLIHSALFLGLYLGIASAVWQIQNPLGNSMTFWTHLADALAFRKVEAFQVKP